MKCTKEPTGHMNRLISIFRPERLKLCFVIIA